MEHTCCERCKEILHGPLCKWEVWSCLKAMGRTASQLNAEIYSCFLNIDRIATRVVHLSIAILLEVQDIDEYNTTISSLVASDFAIT